MIGKENVSTFTVKVLVHKLLVLSSVNLKRVSSLSIITKKEKNYAIKDLTPSPLKPLAKNYSALVMSHLKSDKNVKSTNSG